jgi:hypothetical protein
MNAEFMNAMPVKINSVIIPNTQNLSYDANWDLKVDVAVRHLDCENAGLADLIGLVYSGFY